jgi:hypothetical protein
MVATRKPEEKTSMGPLEGFTEANNEEKLRLVLNVEGMEKCGKTHFALTAPGPIAVIDMDIGLEGVISKFTLQKKIYVASFNYRDATTPDEWEKMWVKMKTAYMDALASKSIRTVIADTATEWWELVRMARFGKLAQVKPHHYAPVNAEFRDLLRKAYDTDKNLILIHKQKKEYTGDPGSWTGNMERAGFGDIGYAVQANILSWRITALDEIYGKGREDGYKGFGITVRDCRQQAELAGTELLEPLNTFPVLASQVFPSTDQSEWE